MIGSACRIPEILALRRRITIVPSEELMHARPRRQAIVEVKTRDGRSLSRRTRAVRGSADNPMNQAEVEAKAFDLIGSVLGARRARAIVRAIAQLETIPDVTALRRLWQPPADRAWHKEPPDDPSALERRCRSGSHHARLPGSHGNRLSRSWREAGRKWHPLGSPDADIAGRRAPFVADDERRRSPLRHRRGAHQFRYSHLAGFARRAAARQSAGGAE